MSWQLHWLETSGDLRPWREAIVREVEIAQNAIAGIAPLPALDILVQRLADEVIPETGTTGQAYRKNLLSLTLDPDNPNFERSLRSGDLRRTVTHEAHHCLRMAGPGYGWTLGEVLVSEGLAGQFVSHVFGTPPELWESAVSEELLKANLPSDEALASSDYDHAAWFFGHGGRFPRWLGYTLGYRVVADWLEAEEAVDGDSWVNVPAQQVIMVAKRRTLSALQPCTE